jgi:hypothetical protein
VDERWKPARHLIFSNKVATANAQKKGRKSAVWVIPEISFSTGAVIRLPIQIRFAAEMIP